MEQGDDRPIGVFDSGTGGLTVLEAMLRLNGSEGASISVPAGLPEFEGERFVYFGDQANMPYGDYPGEGKEDFLRGLVLNDVRFLLKKNVKIIVIACNTATAYGYDAARTLLEEEGADIRLIGVVDSGAADAVSAIQATGGDRPCSIGILATPGTVSAGVYERAVKRELERRGITREVHLFSRGCPGLADAVETGDPWAHEIACGYLRALMGEQRVKAPHAPLQVVILGCTHFPFVRDALESLAPWIVFVDPAASAALACHASLAADGRLATSKETVKLEAFVSVPSSDTNPACLDERGWFTRAYKYVRSDPDDGSTRILPFREAVDSGALTFPAYVRQLPRTAHCLRA